MGRLLLLIGLFLAVTFRAAAQGPDTVKVKTAADSLSRLNSKRDSAKAKPLKPFAPKPSKVKIYRPDSTHSPGLAVRRSAMIPGWGQVYNGKWWKVPLIYAGLGGLGLALEFNHRYYRQYLQMAIYKRDGLTVDQINSQYGGKYLKEYQALSSNVSYQALVDAKNANLRNFQLSILGTVAAWGIQMVDAYIDAKFKHSYTMDNDLGLKITPGLLNNNTAYASNFSSTFTPVLKVSLNFK
ncbi:DUF5683 domain-containing protein [Mucilaginibacter lacusdianchii]|uniref:DUF5683 domain-containing protein n=1 Tax=Mucilaginibacter lacusdianchii TaxID=2684211 RepID=UPI00131C7820|nr:DUF5683 domain-containing protein [Mucilaginibacter sp. JXJ CY 39]